MQEYSFWRDTLTRFKSIKCPNCGFSMGVRRVAPDNQSLYLCSNCVLAVGVDYNTTLKEPKKVGNLRRKKK